MMMLGCVRDEFFNILKFYPCRLRLFIHGFAKPTTTKLLFNDNDRSRITLFSVENIFFPIEQ